jgi:hypothetical protein
MRLFAILLLTLPVPASAFTARNGMQAHKTGTSDITVEHETGSLATDYWCAAGDLAQRELNLPVGTRIWRASPKPRGAGQGIAFTLDQAEMAKGAGLSQFGAGPKDEGMSIGQAVAAHCRMIMPELD